MAATTVMLVDDHRILLFGLRALLDNEPDLDLAGEASDGAEAVEMAEALQPDVLVLDIQLPHLSGLDVIQRVTKTCPHTRIVVLSMHGEEAYVLAALKHGATAYVLKGASGEDLLHAIREAVAGRRYLSPPLSDRAIEFYAMKAEETELDLYETLTAREREILQLAAEGYSSTEIASRLSISPRTAETHRANLMQKLNLHGLTDLVRYAIQRGIIS